MACLIFGFVSANTHSDGVSTLRRNASGGANWKSLGVGGNERLNQVKTVRNLA